ncbi:hypothetical protein RHGRI_029441 [Rhododendron griersonianum]|uniref:Uncharacterized protein n=1 Tax=Rhododendron griersonianum TaxID=479676 RepID=A0AAV6IMM6_9ERIC|nr:hypothetical protein RHGRI_029441 [Rhododendron griersonianum]
MPIQVTPLLTHARASPNQLLKSAGAPFSVDIFVLSKPFRKPFLDFRPDPKIACRRDLRCDEIEIGECPVMN